MKNFTPTIINALAGSTATAEALISENEIMMYVTLAITIATTIFNFVLDCRRKWKEQDKKHKDEGDE